MGYTWVVRQGVSQGGWRRWVRMERCKFCGSPDATVRRHAVPTWFLEEVQADPTRISSYTIYDITGLRSEHFQFPDVVEKTHENLTDYYICESCAYGWLEDMNLAAIGPMTQLLNAKITDIGSVEALVGFLELNSEILVRSAFEVVMACDFLVPSASIPDEHYHAFYRGEMPPGVFVELAFSDEPSHLRIMSGPIENDPTDLARCEYRVAFQAGHLVMMVRHVSGQPYDPYPGNIMLHPEMVVGEELEILKNAIEIVAWDIIAMEYFNEKARAGENTFLGIYDEDPRARRHKHD